MHSIQPASTAVSQIRAESLPLCFSEKTFFYCTTIRQSLQHSSTWVRANKQYVVHLRKLLAFGYSHFDVDTATGHQEIMSLTSYLVIGQ